MKGIPLWLLGSVDTVQADIDQAKSAGDVEDSTFADGNALAKHYGLKVCGQD
jgi:hypothetical protein